MNKTTSVLRDLRSEHRRTQEYMGAKLGISQSQYNKIEKGEKSLEFETLTKIAKIFNVQPKQLFIAIFDGDEDTIKKVYISPENEIKKEQNADTYYKQLASYFETRFLNTYRLYIEVCSRHGIEKHEMETTFAIPAVM